jgi:Uma2 family endonuclease
LLVVEVADSTLEFDREAKGVLYARYNLPEYWIMNLREQVLEVYREPRDGQYASVQTLKRGQKLAPLAGPASPIAVDDLLP